MKVFPYKYGVRILKECYFSLSEGLIHDNSAGKLSFIHPTTHYEAELSKWLHDQVSEHAGGCKDTSRPGAQLFKANQSTPELRLKFASIFLA